MQDENKRTQEALSSLLHEHIQHSIHLFDILRADDTINLNTLSKLLDLAGKEASRYTWPELASEGEPDVIIKLLRRESRATVLDTYIDTDVGFDLMPICSRLCMYELIGVYSKLNVLKNATPDGEVVIQVENVDVWQFPACTSLAVIGCIMGLKEADSCEYEAMPHFIIRFLAYDKVPQEHQNKITTITQKNLAAVMPQIHQRVEVVALNKAAETEIHDKKD